MAKGIKTQTPGEAFIQRLNRLREQRQKENKPMDFSILPEERAAINEQLAKAGRGPITTREIVQGHLDHSDGRTFAQALADSTWQPIMPKQDEGDHVEQGLQAAIREAEKAVRDRKLREMPADERSLYLLREDALKLQQAKATAAEHEKRLASPEVASKLADLRALQDKASFDPAWSVSDMMAVEQAIMQLETPGADLEVGFQLHQAAMGISSVKRQAVVAELKAQHGEAAARLAELEEVIAAESGDASGSGEPPAPKVEKPALQVSAEVYARAKAANPKLFSEQGL
jgi:hypothetical protein